MLCPGTFIPNNPEILHTQADTPTRCQVRQKKKKKKDRRVSAITTIDPGFFFLSKDWHEKVFLLPHHYGH